MVLPEVVIVTNAKGETLRLPLPESTVLEAWIPSPLVAEVI